MVLRKARAGMDENVRPIGLRGRRGRRGEAGGEGLARLGRVTAVCNSICEGATQGEKQEADDLIRSTLKGEGWA